MSAAESIERIHALLALYRESHYDVDCLAGGAATLRIGARTFLRRSLAGSEANQNPVDVPDRLQSALAIADAGGERTASGTTAPASSRAPAAQYLEGAGHVPGEKWREPSLLVRGIGAAALGCAGPGTRAERHLDRAGERPGCPEALSLRLGERAGTRHRRRMGSWNAMTRMVLRVACR